jgi:hypothetical protein
VRGVWGRLVGRHLGGGGGGSGAGGWVWLTAW